MTCNGGQGVLLQGAFLSAVFFYVRTRYHHKHESFVLSHSRSRVVVIHAIQMSGT